MAQPLHVMLERPYHNRTRNGTTAVTEQIIGTLTLKRWNLSPRPECGPTQLESDSKTALICREWS